MPPSKRLRPALPPPQYFEAQGYGLGLESTLTDLPLHQFQVAAHYTGKEVAAIFERHPALPGVVLLEQGEFLGMISRQRLLEYLLHPRGLALFLPSALSVLYSYAQTPPLLVSASTSILTTAQMALRRPPQQRGEPIVVQLDPQTYRLLDVHELHTAYWQIRGVETQVRYERAQAQMIQTEKMASLGRLVDGVAHEILDPVGFIWGNLVHLSTYTQQVMELLATYEAHYSTRPPEIEAMQLDMELDYLRDDLPQTINSIRSGAERLKNLVSSLQNFCHIDDVYPKPADLHECLNSILLLLKSRLSSEIQIVKDFGTLPPVPCFAGQLNQVFMNVLTHAVNGLLNQATRQEWAQRFRQPALTDPINARVDTRVDARTTDEPKPRITITTQIRSAPLDEVSSPAARWVLIRIADNGAGVEATQRQQILDSFSIEKRTDIETSLAVSYQIVTAKHGGKFYFRSRTLAEVWGETGTQANAPTCPVGSGSEFEIWLPLV